MSKAGDVGASPDKSGLEDASDEQLMLRVANGDDTAFRRLAERYAKKSFAIARRISASDEDAEEIVQEAMIRVWTSAPRWRADAAFLTWLYRIVVNLCLNRRRQRSFVPLDDAGDPPDLSPSAIDQLEAKQANRLVTTALARLPERQRAAIALTYYEGFSNAETAAALDTTVSGIESLLIRAKRTLRAELGTMLDPKVRDNRS